MSRISDGRDKGRRSHFLLRDECKRKAWKREQLGLRGKVAKSESV